MSLLAYFCHSLFLIHTINAINTTHSLVAYVESSQYTTTIPNDYDTIYEIYIEYDYIAPHQPIISSHSLGDIFAQSTYKAFKTSNVDIYDMQYCVVFTQYYNESGLCSHYEYQGDMDTHIAYGTFIGKKTNHLHYNIDEIITLTPFKSILANHLTKLVGLGVFSIIDVDISEMDISQDTTHDNAVIFTMLDIIDSSLYILLYVFVSLCIFAMFIAKSCSVYQRHDAITFTYFIHFILFTLNFFANSVILPLRIFEQSHYILGTVSVLLCVVIRLKFDVSTTLKSKPIWIKPAFISKHIHEWYERFENVLITLSIISGPIGSLSFANSRLFVADLFFMNVPQSMIIHFVGKLFWKILVIQRLPEFGVQIAFVYFCGYDHYWVFAVLTSVLCFWACVHRKLQLHLIEENNEFLVQRSSFLMEVSSEEISHNASKYLLQPNAFKQGIADILGISPKCVELPSFEAINVATESNYNKNKVSRCYGLKIYISVNTTSMLRRSILMKLAKAHAEDSLEQKIQKVWGLSEMPSIDDIVMVYDLGGDLVIQRAYSWEDPITEESKNFRFIQERNNAILANQTELIDIIQKELIIQNETELRKDSNSDEGIDIMFINETSHDTNETSVTMDERESMDMSPTDESHNPFDLYMSENPYRRRRMPSKMHVPDQSFMSDINMEDMLSEENDFQFTVQLQKVTSDSSVKTLVSL